MRFDRAPLGLSIAAIWGLLFLHVPLLLIFLYAFTTEDRSYQFPPPGFTLDWFRVAFFREDIWAAIWLSVQVAAIATLHMLVVATMDIAVDAYTIATLEPRERSVGTGVKIVCDAAADFLRNPDDARDWNAAPGAAGARRGQSDRFVLRFVKPG